MGYADEVKEITTGTENHLQPVEMEEEYDQVVGLERKPSPFAHAKRPDSADSSTITTTNTSSSSSFSGDGFTGLSNAEVLEVQGEHDDVNNGNVYLDGEQGSDSSDAESVDHESQTVDHLNGKKKVTEFEKGSSSQDKKESREIDEVKDGDILEEVEVIEEEEVDIEDVKDYKAKKLLENQKISDLLCPRCKDCITKVVVLKKRVVVKKIKRNNRPVRGTRHILVDPPLGSVDSQPPSVGGNNDIPDQSFFYKCLSCLCIFKSTVADPKPVPGSGGVEGVNTQPKPHAKVDFNCLRGMFGFKEPAVEQEANLHDPSEGFNHGAPVEDGQQFLEPSREEEASAADTNQTTGKGRHLSPIIPSLPVSNTVPPDGLIVDIPPLPVIPLEQPTLEEALLTPAAERRTPEILKSIVYGGLIEAITSLGVISSAAGSGASTLNILVLGLANLFGGLILIIHNLQELREEEPIRETTDDNGEEETRYKRLLGRRENFMLHATLAILSFIITGLLPPVVYYFSFRESHNKDYKVGSVFGASLICITFLALAKAHVRSPRGSYLKSVLYYGTNAVSVSGITYVVGNVVNQLLEKYGWSDGSETPVGEMMLSLMGRKAGGFGYSSSY